MKSIVSICYKKKYIFFNLIYKRKNSRKKQTPIRSFHSICKSKKKETSIVHKKKKSLIPSIFIQYPFLIPSPLYVHAGTLVLSNVILAHSMCFPAAGNQFPQIIPFFEKKP